MNAKLGQEATFFSHFGQPSKYQKLQGSSKEKKIFYPDAASLLHK